MTLEQEIKENKMRRRKRRPRRKVKREEGRKSKKAELGGETREKPRKENWAMTGET